MTSAIMTSNSSLYSRGRRVVMSPRARRALAVRGADQALIEGTGPDRRIVEADVLAGGAPSCNRSIDRPRLSIMRRTIAQRTAESFATAPHFYLRTEIDATALVALRSALVESMKQRAGARLTLTDLIVKAMGISLKECPQSNCIWEEGTIRPLPDTDIGLVVGLEDGLMIPIIRGVNRRSLEDLARERSKLIEAVRGGRLTAEQTQGAAISLSNLGNTKVDDFSAVLPPPYSAILAVGRAIPRPFVVHGELCVRVTLKLCLSVDHRVLDGGPAAAYLGRVVELLENPLPLTGLTNVTG